MRKLSVAQLTIPDLGLQESVDLIARAGIQGIGLHRDTVAKHSVPEVRRILRDAGVAAASYMSAGRFLMPGEYERRLEDSRRAVDTAAELEADVLYVIAGPREGRSFEEADAILREGILSIAERARTAGVRLAFEPVHPILTHLGYIHRLGDALDLVRPVPGLGIVLDTWHLGWDRALLADIARSEGRVLQVQLSDYDAAAALRTRAVQRHPIGEGKLPLAPIVQALEHAGFDRFYDVEVIMPSTPERQRALIQESREAFDRLW